MTPVDSFAATKPFTGSDNVYKKLFAIKELEQLSGIKAHTIRVWEMRYNFFSPLRNAGNVRSYSIEDVQRLLNTALLLKHGYRISLLSKLPLNDLQYKIQKMGSEEGYTRAINDLIIYQYLNIEKFEAVLDACVKGWGIDITIEKVILPFQEKVGLLTYKDSHYETHFIVTAIRKKIIFGIENHASKISSYKTALLFLPEGEHFDLFLLYLAFVLRRKGLRVLYLGTNISLANLQRITQAMNINFLFTYVPLKQKFKLNEFTAYLTEYYPELRLNAVICEDLLVAQSTGNVHLINYKLVNEYIDALACC